MTAPDRMSGNGWKVFVNTVLGSNPGGPNDFPFGITSLVAAVIRYHLSRPLGAAS